MKTIPTPTIERLSILYTVLKRLEDEKVDIVSSKEIGSIMGISAHTVRKDISYLNLTGSEAGYDTAELKKALDSMLEISKKRKACIAGLGRLGCAIMNFSQYISENIKIEAGFDSSINVLETMEATIPVFPAYDITEIVASMGIEIAIITVPPEYAQITAERLIKGGIKGIVNFAPVVIKTDNEEVIIKNFHIMEELRTLSILIDQKERKKSNGKNI